jgi:hypothetical protein
LVYLFLVKHRFDWWLSNIHPSHWGLNQNQSSPSNKSIAPESTYNVRKT